MISLSLWGCVLTFLDQMNDINGLRSKLPKEIKA